MAASGLRCLYTLRQQHLDHAAHAARLGGAAEATLGLHGRRAILPWSRLPSRPRAVLPRRRLLLAAVLAGLRVHLLLTGVLAGGRLLSGVLTRLAVRLLLPRVLPRRRLLAGVLPMLARGRLAWVAARGLARISTRRLAWVAARARSAVARLACRTEAMDCQKGAVSAAIVVRSAVLVRM